MNFPIVKMTNPVRIPRTAINIAKPAAFVRMEYDASQQVVSRFLDAVRVNPESAWAFVSKVHSAALDLNALQELLDAEVQHVKMAAYVSSSKNCIIRSICVKDPVGNGLKFLHLRMVKQPDHNGKWKIFGVEQEE